MLGLTSQDGHEIVGNMMSYAGVATLCEPEQKINVCFPGLSQIYRHSTGDHQQPLDLGHTLVLDIEMPLAEHSGLSTNRVFCEFSIYDMLDLC